MTKNGDLLVEKCFMAAAGGGCGENQSYLLDQGVLMHKSVSKQHKSEGWSANVQIVILTGQSHKSERMHMRMSDQAIWETPWQNSKTLLLA